MTRRVIPSPVRVVTICKRFVRFLVKFLDDDIVVRGSLLGLLLGLSLVGRWQLPVVALRFRCMHVRNRFAKYFSCTVKISCLPTSFAVFTSFHLLNYCHRFAV